MSRNLLRVAACVSMLIDHVGFMFFPGAIVFRMIGRIAMPLFAFLLAEGCRKTNGFGKYCFRLWILAVISEVPFDLAFFGGWWYLGYQNVVIGLALAASAIFFFERMRKLGVTWVGYIGLIVAMVLGEISRADYGGVLVCLVAVLYFCQDRTLQIIVVAVGGFLLNFSGWNLELSLCASFAAVLIIIYNGKRGSIPQWISYWFYPFHLVILFSVRWIGVVI